MSSTRIKLLEQSIASTRRKIAGAADKDSLRRQIAAMEVRLASERKKCKKGHTL